MENPSVVFGASTGRKRGSTPFLALFLIAIALIAPREGSAADPFPSRPVKLIIPFGPGGAADPPGRLLAEGLAKIWGQPVVVENRPGAGGNIGADTVSKAEPDGYTLLFTSNAPLIVNPSIYKDMPFDPKSDLAPITLAYTTPMVLFAATNVPVKTFPELVAYLKAQPGKLTYSSGGPGTVPHLAAELLRLQAGLDVIHVPYRTGADLTASVLKGETTFNFNGFFAMELARAGKMTALAIGSPKRSPLAPELPTIAESGYPGYSIVAWGGLLAPAKTPPDILAKIHADAVQVLGDPALKDKLATTGFEPTSTSMADFGKQIRDEGAFWAKIIKDANIRLE